MPSNKELYLRNIIFGVSDSLISTVGLLSGINIGGTTKATILLTGIVFAFVEAFSMAVGSFLSEQLVQQYRAKGEIISNKPIMAGIAIFVSFVLASFIPIMPYVLFNTSMALAVSIVLSVLALFILGLISSRIVKVNKIKHAVRMALLGGAAIIIGAVVGRFIK